MKQIEKYIDYQPTFQKAWCYFKSSILKKFVEIEISNEDWTNGTENDAGEGYRGSIQKK